MEGQEGWKNKQEQVCLETETNRLRMISTVGEYMVSANATTANKQHVLRTYVPDTALSA